MSTKLNQIIAVTKAVSSAAHAELTAVHHDAQRTQKDGPLHGVSRIYQPAAEDGEQFPSESTRVQIRVDDLIERATSALTRMFDVTATRDVANCKATADVVVDGQTLLRNIPVTYLLWLEKQLVDLHTFVAKLPTLDPAESWEYDPAKGCWATSPTRTARTKKIPRNHILSEAVIAPNGNIAPAQVQTYTEDIMVGTWTTVKLSGALPAQRVRELEKRVRELQLAVKMARESANSAAVEDQSVGDVIFGYLFA